MSPEDHAKSFERLSRRDLEASVDRYVIGSEQRAGAIIALERKIAAEKKVERDLVLQQFREEYDQTERHHIETIAASKRQAYRAEIVAWAAILVSVITLILSLILGKA